jgi:hypothetical protein
MNRWHPKYVILLGFGLVFLGFALPFLMVMRLVEPSFLLSFISYGSSVAGLFLGIIGASMFIKGR